MFRARESAPLGSTRLDHADRRSRADGPLRIVVAGLAVLSALFLPGCSGSSGAYPVNEPQARDALRFALDAWKKGETSRSLASSSSPMTVQDFEWDSGAKLIEYEILDGGKLEGSNLRVQVKLTTLGEPAKAKKEAKPAVKKASYVVGTSPSLTVFRDIMRR